MVRTGPRGALVRSTARSKDGSKYTGVAAYDVLPRSTCVLPRFSPAMTCAFVATRPGPTTKPDPSCSLVQAVPRIFTVENTAGSASALVCALVGGATLGLDG